MNVSFPLIAPATLNHIGIAVSSIERHRDYYEKTLGATYEGIEAVVDQHVRVAFFRLGRPGHGTRIELIEPAAPDTPISRFLAKRGEGLHHMAYTVDDLDACLARLKAAGYRLIDETPRQGAHGMRVAFLHPQSTGGVLTELCEPASPNPREQTNYHD